VEIVRDWFRRNFSDPQVVILTGLLLFAALAIALTAHMLAPVIASVIIAYLLHPPVRWLKRLGLSHLPAVTLVFLLFVAVLVIVLLWLLPLLLQQLTQLAQQIPGIMLVVQSALMELPERYPNVVSEAEVGEFLVTLRGEVVALSQRALSYSFASVVGAMTLAVYLILMPFMVFFFLKDRDRITTWIVGFLPPQRELASLVWHDVERQISNYVRGKAVEIVIVAAVTFVTFWLLGLNYAALLAALTGVSVLIPYVGAAVVTLPVALVAYAQWGITNEFLYVLLAYAAIQGLDGNVLAPLLLGDAVNLHPIAVIVAILLFGGLWGLWGVFFAIPLATVVQAVIRAWPRRIHAAAEPREGPPPGAPLGPSAGLAASQARAPERRV
jgi:putative permease